MSIRNAFMAALAAVVLVAAGAAFAQQATRTVTAVTDNLYRFQNNAHVSVFLLTEEGAVLVDPINADAAYWIRDHIKREFGRDVTTVIYSHDHADHTSGGEVFADTATFIAHKNARPKIVENGHTPPPELTFSSNMEVVTGGEVIELHHFGPSHSDNLVTVLFPNENAVFVVDVAAVERLPYRTLPGLDYEGTIDYLKAVEALDFDVFVAGHGPVGDKADIAAHRGYLEELHAAVTDGRARGLTLEEAKETITMDAYAGWGQYDAWLKENIEGMWRITGG